MRESLRTLAALGLVLVAGASAVLAQQPQAPAPTGGLLRLAFVNARQVLQSMPGYAQAESTWSKEVETVQKELQRLQAAFDSSVANFDQTQAMMTATNRATRRKELETQRDTFDRRAQELQQRVASRERELLAPMQQRVTAVIEGIRAEGNYAMIIDLGAQASGTLILAYDRALDITQRVLQRLRPSD